MTAKAMDLIFVLFSIILSRNVAFHQPQLKEIEDQDDEDKRNSKAQTADTCWNRKMQISLNYCHKILWPCLALFSLYPYKCVS